MRISKRGVAGIGLLVVLVLGMAGSASGQEDLAVLDQNAISLNEKIERLRSGPGEYAKTPCGDASQCSGGCEACGGCAASPFCSPCNMFPHYPYFPPMHGYYYFRPYHHLHVIRQQRTAESWGGDPRNPYANEIFQRVYAEYAAEHAK